MSCKHMYNENICKKDMIDLYESFIALACTLVFSFGINLYSYLYARKPPASVSASASASASQEPESESESEPLLATEDQEVRTRATRYHSDNTIKYSQSAPFTQHEKYVCYDFVNTMALLFILKKHAYICNTVKLYNGLKKTGVFKFEDKFIIKYVIFTDMREATVYNELNSRGINHDAKIVTPVWYSYFENRECATKTRVRLDLNSDSGSDSDSDSPSSPSSDSSQCKITLYDHVGKKNIRVRTKDIVSIEIQPFLKCSVVFHKWYASAHFNPKNHDYVIGTMMLSLARSIKYCHDLNIVHGDIKPDNLMVTYGTEDPDWQTKLKTVGKTREHNDIPNVYLIDFGMCGYAGKHDGTGGTRPFCAPETKNIMLPPNSRYGLSRTNYDSDSDTYQWCSLNKQHDIWSWALILFTVTAYHDVYNTYEAYPNDTFDACGYVNESQLDYASEIKTHPFYRIFEKTLRPPASRTSSIDEVIRLLDVILQEM